MGAQRDVALAGAGLPRQRVLGPRGLVGGRQGRLGRLRVEGSSQGGGISGTFNTGSVLVGLRAVEWSPLAAWFSFPVGAKSWRGVGRA